MSNLKSNVNQHCLLEFSMMIEIFFICTDQYGSPCHMLVLNIWNMASVTEELKF